MWFLILTVVIITVPYLILFLAHPGSEDETVTARKGRRR